MPLVMYPEPNGGSSERYILRKLTKNQTSPAVTMFTMDIQKKNPCHQDVKTCIFKQCNYLNVKVCIVICIMTT